MIDTDRSEVLRALEALSEVCPEYRLGQMIANLAMLARGDAESARSGISKTQSCWLRRRKHLADWNARHEPAA